MKQTAGMSTKTYMHGSAAGLVQRNNFKEVLHLHVFGKYFYNKSMNYLLSFYDSFDKAENLCKNEETPMGYPLMR